MDVLLERRERCLRELLLFNKNSSSSSFDTTTTRKDDDEEKKRVEFGSMIQLANGASNYEDVMKLYPADCDFAKKKTGLEKVEHECTVAPSRDAEAMPNAMNTFWLLYTSPSPRDRG